MNLASERYSLTGELGRGGMAVVHRARDTRHGRDVAVKLMLPAVAESVGADRFLREIETAARLQHPHIVPVFDSGNIDGQLFFITAQLIDGTTDAHLWAEKYGGTIDDVPRKRSQRTGSSTLTARSGYTTTVFGELSPLSTMYDPMRYGRISFTSVSRLSRNRRVRPQRPGFTRGIIDITTASVTSSRLRTSGRQTTLDKPVVHQMQHNSAFRASLFVTWTALLLLSPSALVAQAQSDTSRLEHAVARQLLPRLPGGDALFFTFTFFSRDGRMVRVRSVESGLALARTLNARAIQQPDSTLVVCSGKGTAEQRCHYRDARYGVSMGKPEIRGDTASVDVFVTESVRMPDEAVGQLFGRQLRFLAVRRGPANWEVVKVDLVWIE